MKVSKNNKKINFPLETLDPLSNLSYYMTEAEKFYSKDQKEVKNLQKNKFFLTSNENERNNTINTFKTTKSDKIPLINPRLYNPTQTEENFNVMKKVKEIRELTEKNFRANDPFMRHKMRVAFDSRNSNIIFDARKQIDKFNRRQAGKLLDKVGSLQQFYRENKQIAINNVLIKLLKNESKKLNDLENEKSKKLEDGKLKEINNEKNFEEYSLIQKYTVKEIDKTINVIQDKYRQLLIKARKIESKNLTLQDEIYKKLNQINDLKIYAQFTNKALNGPKRFDQMILNTNDYNVNKNIPIDVIVNETINFYSFLFDEKNLGEEKTALELIEDPQNLIDEFHRIEKNIIKKLNKIENINKEKINNREEENNNINELKIQLAFFEKEYKVYNDNYKKLLEEYSKFVALKAREDTFTIELIKDLYENIINNRDTNVTKLVFNKKNKMKIEDLIKELMIKIKTEERKINNYITNLENYEMNDPNTFIPVIYEYREELKKTKLIQAIHRIDQQLNEKNLLSQKKYDKVIIQSRKTAPPFRIVKKKVKKEDNLDKIRENEEMDLLFY